MYTTIPTQTGQNSTLIFLLHSYICTDVIGGRFNIQFKFYSVHTWFIVWYPKVIEDICKIDFLNNFLPCEAFPKIYNSFLILNEWTYIA
jgi:hypothetical protein